MRGVITKAFLTIIMLLFSLMLASASFAVVGPDQLIDAVEEMPTTLRSFDESYSQINLQLDGSWWFNPIFSLFLSAEYNFAESVDLEEGGVPSTAEIDASGFDGRFGLGINF